MHTRRIHTENFRATDNVSASEYDPVSGLQVEFSGRLRACPVLGARNVNHDSDWDFEVL